MCQEAYDYPFFGPSRFVSKACRYEIRDNRYSCRVVTFMRRNKVVHNPQIISRRVDSQWVLLEKDHAHVRQLNESAGLLWSLTKSPVTLSFLARKLRATYNIPLDTAEADVREFVESYLNEGLLIEAPDTKG